MIVILDNALCLWQAYFYIGVYIVGIYGDAAYSEFYVVCAFYTTFRTPPAVVRYRVRVRIVGTGYFIWENVPACCRKIVIVQVKPYLVGQYACLYVRTAYMYYVQFTFVLSQQCVVASKEVVKQSGVALVRHDKGILAVFQKVVFGYLYRYGQPRLGGEYCRQKYIYECKVNRFGGGGHFFLIL